MFGNMQSDEGLKVAAAAVREGNKTLAIINDQVCMSYKYPRCGVVLFCMCLILFIKSALVFYIRRIFAFLSVYTFAFQRISVS